MKRKNSPQQKCLFTVIGYGGAAVITMAATAENLEKYLFGTGTFWIVAGTIIAVCWSYVTHCEESEDEEH